MSSVIVSFVWARVCTLLLCDILVCFGVCIAMDGLFSSVSGMTGCTGRVVGGMDAK